VVELNRFKDIIYRLSVPDLPIGSIGWSLGTHDLGGLRPRCIIFLTLLLDFHTYAVIAYCTFLATFQ
jgi:hypothetical protein